MCGRISKFYKWEETFTILWISIRNFQDFSFSLFLRCFRKKKEIIPLWKRIEKEGRKKNSLRDTRGFPNSFTFYYSAFLSRDEIIMPALPM